jgi:hypothetical protein
MVGCTPRPPTWPPSSEALAETAPWLVAGERFRTSVHGTIACTVCHADIQTSDPAAPHPNVQNLLQEATALYDYQACESCHPQAYSAYQHGVHADAMADPDSPQADSVAPTCGHCHDIHYATPATRQDLLVAVSEACGSCHPEELESYQHNYHGKAALLGYEQTATCADCHGAHTVLTLQDSGESMPACRRCHPGADERFVRVNIHVQETLNPDPQHPRAADAKLFFWIKLFFTFLVAGVLTFFYAHTGMWFLRSLHERLRRRGHHD